MVHTAEIDGSYQSCVQAVVAIVDLVGKPLECSSCCDFIISIDQLGKVGIHSAAVDADAIHELVVRSHACLGVAKGDLTAFLD